MQIFGNINTYLEYFIKQFILVKGEEDSFLGIEDLVLREVDSKMLKKLIQSEKIFNFNIRNIEFYSNKKFFSFGDKNL
jgi:hypothetical protein